MAELREMLVEVAKLAIRGEFLSWEPMGDIDARAKQAATEYLAAHPTAPEPAAMPEAVGTVRRWDWIDGLTQAICEIDGRTSPEDQPEMMLVTAEELRRLIAQHLPTPAVTPEPTNMPGDESLLDKAQRFAEEDERGSALVGRLAGRIRELLAPAVAPEGVAPRPQHFSFDPLKREVWPNPNVEAFKAWRDAPTETPVAPEGVAEPTTFDLIQHLLRQIKFSEKAFGHGVRTAGVIDHIRKELREIEAAPHDLSEWIDVVILACDGAWRSGHTPEQIVAALDAKLTKNEARTWPDWHTADPNKAIEHDRSGEPVAPPEAAAPNPPTISESSPEPSDALLIGRIKKELASLRVAEKELLDLSIQYLNERDEALATIAELRRDIERRNKAGRET